MISSSTPDRVTLNCCRRRFCLLLVNSPDVYLTVACHVWPSVQCFLLCVFTCKYICRFVVVYVYVWPAPALTGLLLIQNSDANVQNV